MLQEMLQMDAPPDFSVLFTMLFTLIAVRPRGITDQKTNGFQLSKDVLLLPGNMLL